MALQYKEDLYSDGKVLKTVQRVGYTTASPSRLDTLFFDFRLEHKGVEIMSTFTPGQEFYNKDTKCFNLNTKFGERFYQEKKVHCSRLNEFRWSKILEDVLRSMKKFEVAQVDIFATDQLKTGETSPEAPGAPSLFGWGKDFISAKKALEQKYQKEFEQVLEECKIGSGLMSRYPKSGSVFETESGDVLFQGRTERVHGQIRRAGAVPPRKTGNQSETASTSQIRPRTRSHPRRTGIVRREHVRRGQAEIESVQAEQPQKQEPLSMEGQTMAGNGGHLQRIHQFTPGQSQKAGTVQRRPNRPKCPNNQHRQNPPKRVSDK